MSEKNQTRIHMKMNCHITDEKMNNRNKFVKTSLKYNVRLVQESKIRKTKMMFVSCVKQVIRIAAHQAFFARDQKKMK